MNYTQNQKIKQVTDTTIVVGIDIGSQVHYARAFDWRRLELGRVFQFENTLEGFGQFINWVEELKRKHNKDQVLVGVEPTGHYWFGIASYCKEFGFPLVIVNPFHVKRSKEFDDNNPTKNDRKDPKVIAKLVLDGRYSIPYIPEGVYAELRIMTACRMRIVKELGSCKNRIARWLKIYFPEHEEVYGSFEAVSSMAILKIAPLPQDIIELGAEAINEIWRKSKMRAVGMKRATSLLEAAKRSIGCKDGSFSARIEIKMLLEDYERKLEQYEKIMNGIEELCNEIPEVKALLEIQGIGLVTVAGFLSEVGDIRRFTSPKQIQKLAGLALMENSSGKHQGQTTINKRGRRRLRAILFQAVMPLVAKNKEFKELHNYYTRREKNPLKKKQSLIAICCKLIRVFYAILSKGIQYNAEKMISDIKRPVELQAA